MTTNAQAVETFFKAPAYQTPIPVETAAAMPGEASRYEMLSSQWWLERLCKKLDARTPKMQMLRQYYRGEQDTWKLSSEAHRLSFGRAFAGMKANMAKLIVEAPKQRLRVVGFRIPIGGNAESERGADSEAWRIWQANGLDSKSSVAHSEALSIGECPILVHPGPDPRAPKITVLDPMQVYVENDPFDSSQRRAAIKRTIEEDGTTVAVLYLPDRIEHWKKTSTSTTWEQVPLRGGTNPLGKVPIVMLVNKPRVDGHGEAEHESVLPLIDAVNKTLLDMLTTSEFSAFPQRYAIGVALDNEGTQPDAEGNVAETPIKQAVDRWVTTESPDAQFGQFPVTNLEPYTKALEEYTTLIGTITFTPYHYLLNMPSSVPATGEALKTAETSLVAKAEDTQVDFGEAWEEVMRLAFQLVVVSLGQNATGEDRARSTSRSETIWRDAESRTESQHIDALVKLATLGVPQEALWERIPATPAEIERWRGLADTKKEASRDQVDAAGALVRAGFAPDAALVAVGLDPIRHLGLLPITLQTDPASAEVATAAIAGGELPTPESSPTQSTDGGQTPA